MKVKCRDGVGVVVCAEMCIRHVLGLTMMSIIYKARHRIFLFLLSPPPSPPSLCKKETKWRNFINKKKTLGIPFWNKIILVVEDASQFELDRQSDKSTEKGAEKFFTRIGIWIRQWNLRINYRLCIFGIKLVFSCVWLAIFLSWKSVRQR